ncbi:MAG TPA: tRNA lysidine(34) synthetase TilS [Chitinophagaceae bacterium]|nr:tRNA lysidine(34) synthetase TilS [Chitinophagaceae bacterium]
MDPLLTKFEDFIRSEHLFRKGHRLLVAVSGGVDSVVLARLCRSAGYYLEIAHCNFQLRGDESLRDEEYTAQFAEMINAPYHVQRFDTAAFASNHHISIQEAARELRYTFFRETARSKGLDRILTAHHADDNVETMLMNLFKGTGIAGIRGMLPLSGNIARPLLFASRAEIESYAAEHGIGFVEDSSNLTEKYTRNYFRLNLIPQLEKMYPGATDHIKASLSFFREAEVLYREAVNAKISDLTVVKANEIHIPVEKLRMATPLRTILFEMLSPAGFSPAQLNDVLALMDAETGKYLSSSSHRLIKNRNWFILVPTEDAEVSVHLLDKDTEKIQLSIGTITTSTIPVPAHFIPESDPLVAQLDWNQLEFPLAIRKWKEGDYFYPLGMQKKKKIARFLIDLKLSKTQKENTMVVTSGDRIVWVVGQRIDDRVKIRPSTDMIYVMKLNS